MTNDEILAALDAPGCERCRGTGDNGHSRCVACNGTGVTPRAMLCAVQAIGHLLVDVLAELREAKR